MFKAVILGAPGSGKGTISAKIVEAFEVIHLSAGDMLRKEIKVGTKTGAIAKKYVDEGKLVPDNVVLALITSALKKLPSTTDWILDGFPRTRQQAEKLQAMQPITYAINLVVSFEVIIDRIKGRWIHVPSGRVYNDNYNAPKVKGIDDVTGEPLEQREDDKPESMKRRLQIYSESMEPLRQFYLEKNVLHEFKGDNSDHMWKDIQKALAPHLKPRT